MLPLILISSYSKKQKNKAKRQKEEEEKQKTNDMADDELLDYLIDQNHKCAFKNETGKQCKKTNALYLRACLMCGKKFCFPHLQPEVHDCDKLN